MKRSLITMMVCYSVYSGKAQTFNEWFKQKKTQTKYLIEQIAALKVYAGIAKKGYDIARSGLCTIRDIKKGDLNLHNNYFSSLKSVNPTVSGYRKVFQIIQMQIAILKLYEHSKKQIDENGKFSIQEVNYYTKVFSNLLSSSLEIVDELTLVTTSGKLEMKDDERIKRIDSLYAGMKDNYAFAQSFSSDAEILALQRQKEKKSISMSRSLHGIK